MVKQSPSFCYFANFFCFEATHVLILLLNFLFSLKTMESEGGNKGVQILLFSCMIIGALLVILTCIWKLIKLVAMYKMESRIEDLERLSAAQNNGSVAPADISGMMSPKEARSLRKLSILAGFDRRPARSARSSISAGGNSTNSNAFAG